MYVKTMKLITNISNDISEDSVIINVQDMYVRNLDFLKEWYDIFNNKYKKKSTIFWIDYTKPNKRNMNITNYNFQEFCEYSESIYKTIYREIGNEKTGVKEAQWGYFVVLSKAELLIYEFCVDSSSYKEKLIIKGSLSDYELSIDDITNKDFKELPIF